MVRNYKKKKAEPKWNKTDMERAVSAVKSKEMSARNASKRFEIPKTCLLRRLKNNTVSGPRNDNFKPVFSAVQEQELVTHILDLESKFYGLTPRDVQKLAFDLAEKMGIPHNFNKIKELAGKDWLSGFRNRNPQISIREPERTSVARAAAFNRVQVKKFYDILKSVIDQYSIQPDQVFNADETGVNTVPKPRKIIAKKGRKQVGRIVSAERGFNITVTCAISASGQYIPPFFLFPRQRMPPAIMKGCPSGSLGYANGSGWMDSEHFIKYLRHFVTFAKPSENRKALLIIDNHASHRTLEAITFARENNIIMVSLPPHTSHRLQPLDCCIYSSLKSQHARECDMWMTNHPSQRITIYDIVEIFGKAFTRTATLEKAIKGFQITGTVPFDPDVFSEEDYMPSLVTEVLEPQPANSTDVPMIPALPSVDFMNNLMISPTPEKVEELGRETPPLSNTDSATDIFNNPQPTTSSQGMSNSRANKNLQNILIEISSKPISQRSQKTTNRKSKTQHSEELTSSPFKNLKQAEEEEKLRKASLTASKKEGRIIL